MLLNPPRTLSRTLLALLTCILTNSVAAQEAHPGGAVVPAAPATAFSPPPAIAPATIEAAPVVLEESSPSPAPPAVTSAPPEGAQLPEDAQTTTTPAVSAQPREGAQATAAAAPPTPAATATPPPDLRRPPHVDPETLPYTYHQRHLALYVGGRVTWVADGGFDPFSGDDASEQVGVRVGGVPWVHKRLSMAVLGELLGGSTGSVARSEPTSLTTERLLLGAELRYHIAHFLYGYGRLSPGVAHLTAQVGRDAAAQSTDQWGFALDFALGVAVRLAGDANGQLRTPRLHVFAEGGYDVVPTFALQLSAAESGPPRAEPLDLGSVSPGGPFVGLGLGLTY